MRDTNYYDAESVRYSSKRYPAIARNHIQAFYLRRLAVVLKVVKSALHGSHKQMIEIGCADGIVVYALADTFADMFSQIAAVDISPKMIKWANANKGARKIEFGLRESFLFKDTYDLVVEVGVINYADDNEELRFAQKLVGECGLYLCSIAGSDSLFSWFKPDEGSGFNNYHTYAQYEAKIREHFVIEKVIPVGIFIPHIWKIPVLARFIQPIAEAVIAPLFPNLFHEKVYLLRAKSA